MARDTAINLIKFGYLPLPIWLIVSTIAGLLANDYSPLASHVSVLTLESGPERWMANINAIAIGAALILFAIGAWIVSCRKISFGAVCWILFGVSMIANGIWPMGGPMHGLYIIGIANILAPALLLLDTRNQRIQENLRLLTGCVSLAALFYLWMLLNGFDPQAYAGLTQRIFASISYFWPMAYAYQFTKLANAK